MYMGQIGMTLRSAVSDIPTGPPHSGRCTHALNIFFGSISFYPPTAYLSIAILYKAFTVFQFRVVTGIPNFRSKKLFGSLVFPYPFGQYR